MQNPSNISMDGLPSEEGVVERYTLPLKRNLQADPSGNVPQSAVVQESPKVIPKSEAEKDPDAFPVDLPSQNFFYDFGRVYLRKIRGRHQAKLNAAAEARSMEMTMEVVSSLSNVSSRNLTINDFNWCLYWLRERSYTKVQMAHVARCRNKEHLLKVAEGTLEDSTLSNTVLFSRSKLQEKALDVEKLEQVKGEFKFLVDVPLYTATMDDILQLIEIEGSNRSDWEEFSWLADIATFLGHRDDSGRILSVEKRVEIAGDMSPDQLQELRDYVKVANDYGVIEKIQSICSTCHGPIESEVSINAGMFQ